MRGPETRRRPSVARRADGSARRRGQQRVGADHVVHDADDLNRRSGWFPRVVEHRDPLSDRRFRRPVTPDGFPIRRRRPMTTRCRQVPHAAGEQRHAERPRIVAENRRLAGPRFVADAGQRLAGNGKVANRFPVDDGESSGCRRRRHSRQRCQAIEYRFHAPDSRLVVGVIRRIKSRACRDHAVRIHAERQMLDGSHDAEMRPDTIERRARTLPARPTAWHGYGCRAPTTRLRRRRPSSPGSIRLDGCSAGRMPKAIGVSTDNTTAKASTLRLMVSC